MPRFRSAFATSFPTAAVLVPSSIAASQGFDPRILHRLREGNQKNEDIFIGSPPIAFTFGLGGLVTFPMRVGASSVLLEHVTPEVLLDAVDALGATILYTVPTVYRRMLSLGVQGRLRSLRRCISAGETLPLSVYERWLAATGIRIIDGIGSTEMLHIFISAAGDDIRPGARRAVPGYEARVVDENLRDVPVGTIGHLAVRGPRGCRYLDDPRQREYVREGWNMTGDAYVRDEDGYFHYQARTDDMIITGGYNVSGPEVEEVLLEHEAVLECAVVGADDEERGMIVKAYVVLSKGHAPDVATVNDLQEFVKSRIARSSTRAQSSSSMRCRVPRPASSSATCFASGPEGGTWRSWTLPDGHERAGTHMALRPRVGSFSSLGRLAGKPRGRLPATISWVRRDRHS